MAGLEATVVSLLPDWPALSPADRSVVGRDCAAFVRRQIALAPAHLRLGIRILYAVFVLFAALSLSKADAAALARFSACGPAAFAGLERVLRSMTLLAFLEHPAVAGAFAMAEGRQ